MGDITPVHCPSLDYDDTDCLNFNAKKFALTSSLLTSWKPGKVLDIGVSTGAFYARHLPDLLASGSVYGVDVVPEFLQAARERGIHALACHMDREPLPFADGMFDAVVCDSLLEHTLNPKGLLTEIARVLKPGGHLLLCVPNATSAIRRLSLLRGRSPFDGLIDNLFTRDYLKRCSVYYSPESVRWAFKDFFTIDQMLFQNVTAHDPKSWTYKACRLLGFLRPSLRDMVVVVGRKKA